MIYLFFGQDYSAKDQKIREIKNKYLISDQAQHYDFDQLDGSKLSAEDLKKSLITLPVILKQRILLIRKIEKLTDQNKEILLTWINEKKAHGVLLLDSDAAELKNAFFKEISLSAQLFSFSLGKKQNVFDMTRAIGSRNGTEALRILNELMEEGDHPLQIMGGLVWFWGKQKSVVSSDKFLKGLKFLQEADLNIKRSRLKPEYAVEMAVVKLVGMI